MAKSMEDRLRNLKQEKEGESLPSEQKVNFNNSNILEGTDVIIDEEIDVKPADADAQRPKPVPKQNRKGSKALMAELESAKELAEGNKEKYTRLLAEFDNMRARNKKENEGMSDKGAMDTLRNLLPVLDNFDRAMENLPEEEKTGFEEGIEMIYKQLKEVLADMGVKPMDAAGQEFDPNFHNAVIHIEDENYGENTVVEEMQKGYMYKDEVLRHAMVKVAN